MGSERDTEGTRRRKTADAEATRADMRDSNAEAGDTEGTERRFPITNREVPEDS